MDDQSNEDVLLVLMFLMLCFILKIFIDEAKAKQVTDEMKGKLLTGGKE